MTHTHTHTHTQSLTVLTEASVVPGTVSDLESLRINMQILTVLVAALTKPLEEVADGHLGHLVLV